MRILICCLLAFSPLGTFAGPCEDTAVSEQWVTVTGGTLSHASWKVNPDQIHPLRMKNGFKVGVKVSPVSREFYESRFKGQAAAPELVKISIFDMSGDEPEEMTHTYGETNSIQGYNSGGGADRVDELGWPGLELFLHKTNCVRLDALASN